MISSCLQNVDFLKIWFKERREIVPTEKPNWIYFLSPLTPQDGSIIKFRNVVICCSMTIEKFQNKCIQQFVKRKLSDLNSVVPFFPLNILHVAKCDYNSTRRYITYFLALSRCLEKRLLASSRPSVRLYQRMNFCENSFGHFYKIPSKKSKFG